MSEGESDAFKVDPKKTALVLVEYQNEFTTEGGKLYDAVKDCMAAKNTLGNAKNLLEAARKAGTTVIHLPIAFDKVRLCHSSYVLKNSPFDRILSPSISFHK